ncbi:MAG: hypothetical protein HUK24_07665 [Sphaerochaetaceae bacterium]|nr:hypothetical protein [Sphaerochaetaceae bacterium]
MDRRFFKIIFLLIVTFLVGFNFSSCVVAEKLTFNDEISKTTISGKNHIDLTVSDFFVSLVEDLSSWQDKNSEDPILEVAINDFKSNLEKSSNANSVRFLLTGYNTYMGDFSFTDFTALLDDLANGGKQEKTINQDIVKLYEQNGKTRLEIAINMDNYDTLTQIIPFLADPSFEVYGPKYNHDLTEEDYLDMVSFILGEDCPSNIQSSSIKFQIVAPKAISSHNGSLKNSKTVEFSLPILDFLLLHEPIFFFVEY